MLHGTKGPIILSGYKFGVPVAIEMAVQFEESGVDLVSGVVCLEGSHCYIPLEGQDHLHTEGFSIKQEEENHCNALMAFADMYLDFSEDVGHINCCLRNEFDFWNVHGIKNTSGLLQSK